MDPIESAYKEGWRIGRHRALGEGPSNDADQDWQDSDAKNASPERSIMNKLSDGLDKAAERYAYSPYSKTCRSGPMAVDPEEAFKAGARWQAQQSQPQGWRDDMENVTPEMIVAGLEAHDAWLLSDTSAEDLVRSIFLAMLRASAPLTQKEPQ